jgi:hypothetical protein
LFLQQIPVHLSRLNRLKISALSALSAVKYSPKSTKSEQKCAKVNKKLKKINLFMQNKPNFPNDQIHATLYSYKGYEKLTAFRTGKNKPNSNPIQSQFKPKQTQFKPKFILECLSRGPNIERLHRTLYGGATGDQRLTTIDYPPAH